MPRAPTPPQAVCLGPVCAQAPSHFEDLVPIMLLPSLLRIPCPHLPTPLPGRQDSTELPSTFQAGVPTLRALVYVCLGWHSGGVPWDLCTHFFPLPQPSWGPGQVKLEIPLCPRDGKSRGENCPPILGDAMQLANLCSTWGQTLFMFPQAWSGVSPAHCRERKERKIK